MESAAATDSSAYIDDELRGKDDARTELRVTRQAMDNFQKHGAFYPGEGTEFAQAVWLSMMQEPTQVDSPLEVGDGQIEHVPTKGASASRHGPDDLADMFNVGVLRTIRKRR